MCVFIFYDNTVPSAGTMLLQYRQTGMFLRGAGQNTEHLATTTGGCSKRNYCLLCSTALCLEGLECCLWQPENIIVQQ